MTKSKKTKNNSVASIRTKFTRSAIAMSVAAFTGGAQAEVTNTTVNDGGNIDAAYNTTALNIIVVDSSAGSVDFTENSVTNKMSIVLSGDKKAVLLWDDFAVHSDDTIDFGTGEGVYLNKTSNTTDAKIFAGTITGHADATVIFVAPGGLQINGPIANVKNFMVSTTDFGINAADNAALVQDVSAAGYDIANPTGGAVVLGTGANPTFSGKLRIISGGSVSFLAPVSANGGITISSNNGALSTAANTLTTAGTLKINMGTGAVGTSVTAIKTAAATIDLTGTGEINIKITSIDKN